MILFRILQRLKKQIRTFTKYGTASIVDDFLNGIRVWSLNPRMGSVVHSEGSISGTDSGYMRIVQASLSDKKMFSKFKANREYREILEHVDRDLGAKYLQIINSYGRLADSLFDFIALDKCAPFRYTYPSIGRVSPSNLRYVKIALDLKALFGDLNEFRVSEIGIGYGGQYHALTKVSNLKTYTFYDLPQVLQLANLYLSQFIPELNNHLSGNHNDPNKDIDLVISNYAFSELSRNLQEIYLKNVILNSKRGYLIYNEIGKGAFDSIYVEEFVSRIPGAVIVEEFPLTHPKNKLVIWGHDNVTNLVLSR
jgi:hypothetical protein